MARLIRTSQFLIAILVLAFSAFTSAEIHHLELGVANYSQKEGNHQNRFAFLYTTVEGLIQTYGPKGIIYLNDISLDGLELAESNLRAWLDFFNYDQVEIVTLTGDYNTLDLPQTTSVHLGNPGFIQLPSYSPNDETVLKQLIEIAKRSQTGLAITTYYFGDVAPDFISHFQFMLAAQYPDWELKHVGAGHNYRLPNGNSAATLFHSHREPITRVYILKPKAQNIQAECVQYLVKKLTF